MMLVVEDEDLIADNIRTIGAELGMQVETTRRGHEAVTLAASYRFRIAIVDLRLPDMSGVDVITQIRALPEPFGSVPIIAATGETRKALVAALRAGANRIVEKPYHLTLLKDRVVEIMRD